MKNQRALSVMVVLLSIVLGGLSWDLYSWGIYPLDTTNVACAYGSMAVMCCIAASFSIWVKPDRILKLFLRILLLILYTSIIMLLTEYY